MTIHFSRDLESLQADISAMSKMASSCQNGDKQGMEAAAQGAKGQLSDLEQISQDMQMADAALSECKSQMSQLAGKCNGGQCEGQGNNPGNGGTKPWSEGWSPLRRWRVPDDPLHGMKRPRARRRLSSTETAFLKFLKKKSKKKK